MKESDFNTLLKNSLNKYGFSHKMSDIGGKSGTIAKPSDIFYFSENSSGLIEGKLIKGVKAFNFNHIRDNQWESLKKVNNISKYTKGILSLYIYIPYKLKIALFFDINFIINYKNSGNKSFNKKILNKFISSDFIISLDKNNLFDLNNFEEKIIYKIL